MCILAANVAVGGNIAGRCVLEVYGVLGVFAVCGRNGFLRTVELGAVETSIRYVLAFGHWRVAVRLERTFRIICSIFLLILLLFWSFQELVCQRLV